jgi:hypothetical protein
LRKPILPTLLLHERRGLLARPSPLRLVKDHDFLSGRLHIAQVLIPEVMDVLDEAAHLPLRIFLLNMFTGALIAREGLPKDVDQGAVPRKKHSVFVFVRHRTLGCDVETGQRLTCPRDPRDETDRLFAALL